jgi:hypothetical protein
MDIQEELVREEARQGIALLFEKIHGRSIVWDRMITKEKIKEIIAEEAKNASDE